jgi:hypothetical protein
MVAVLGPNEVLPYYIHTSSYTNVLVSVISLPADREKGP